MSKGQESGSRASWSCDRRIAKFVGVEEAIVFQNFSWWIEKNKADGRNLREGSHWTYVSVKALVEIYENVWTVDQMRRIMKKLVDKNLLIKGNFNRKKYDKKTWYAYGDAYLSGAHLKQESEQSDELDFIFSKKKNDC